ncbi:uncharacterized protein LOC121253428 [Juglans microcarpa x Juglans regia]|uniref:uncharacterized protein LOC121253428 n=1 Tax=Juglans microcarpa x Juglans regia TaxID=2249226 RepID=UPI001B7E6B0C|nr:uncharacterized protein LOC121253428 [Juglans microcarpa x Juglans regia]
MKTLSWNCRRLGNPRTVHDLCHLVKENGPNVIFLMETKLRGEKCDSINRRVRSEGCFVVDPEGRKGGLMLLWDQSVELEILNYSNRHINAWVTNEEGNERWLLTGFYGQPETSLREEAWKLLASLRLNDGVGWCVVGDFNEILTHDEKVGGKQRQEKQMNMFRNVLERGGLFYLGWRGDKFTWSNKHDNETFTKERLDRAVANLRWKEIYKEGWVEVLTAKCSDHKPLLLSMNQVLSIAWRRRRMFRYEARWSLEEDCEEVIKNVWTTRQARGDSAKSLQKLLEDSKGAFVKWNKHLENDKGKILKEKT